MEYAAVQDIDVIKVSKMDNLQEQEETHVVYSPEDHPWLEVPGEVDEDLRFSLDELRFA